MDGSFGLRRRIRRPTINITSLIDVMFLLLIFFMVSSTFREQLGIDVALPQAESAVEQERPPHEITVRDDGSFFLGEQMVSPAELRAALEQWVAEDPGQPLVLRADEAAAFQNVITAIDIARSVGGMQLIIPTQPLDSGEATSPAAD